jgi:UDP-glucose 4-epimerase
LRRWSSAGSAAETGDREVPGTELDLQLSQWTRKKGKMHVFVTGAATELGREVIRWLVDRGHYVTGMIRRRSESAVIHRDGGHPLVADPASAVEIERALHIAEADIVLNLSPQKSNTLLHDGHGWRGLDKTLPLQTAALLQAANACGVKFLLHGSYAFLYGTTQDGDGGRVTEATPLPSPGRDRLSAAAIEAEKMVVENKQFPVCIMRIGYLYGPQSRDLALYKTSFKRKRPYYAGPKEHRANFVHFADAARALILASEKQPADVIINIVDGSAVSFGTFIDAFAQTLDRKKPRRIPTWAVRFAPLITPQQVKQLKLHAVQVDNSKARQLLDWTLAYPSYREGLAQTVSVWREEER